MLVKRRDATRMPPGIIISGKREYVDSGNMSATNPKRAPGALRLCKSLGINCTFSPAVYLTTNGKGRCGSAAQSLTGGGRGVVGLHLAHIDVWKKTASTNMSTFIFEDDARLPEGVGAALANKLLRWILLSARALPERNTSKITQPIAAKVTQEPQIDMVKLGYCYAGMCLHAYLLTPNGATALLRYDVPSRHCLPSFPADHVTSRACSSKLLTCANSGPDFPNWYTTRFEGFVKQAAKLVDRGSFGWR